jgi:tetratricopeptide (TPR) repeat protein
MDQTFKYRAFISYSHADEQWAKWLHRSLETYRIPKYLVGRETEFGPVPERFAPVFRDRDELATATSLGETLTRALQQSASQIVICSPAAARSRWVNEEILTFKRMGKAHRIFCLFVAGEPGASMNPERAAEECFPNALIFEMGPDGQLTDQRSEPIGADVRPGKDSRQDVRLKLLAGILGVGLDELKQRDAQRRHRRMVALVAASIAGMAITSGLATAAWLARNEAERQQVRAEQEAETARQTTQFMVGLFRVSDPSEALGNTITAREILDKGAARIETELADQPVIQATLMDTMGTVYTSLGLYDAAVPLVRQAFEKRQALYGRNHAEVAASLNHLGEVLGLKADFGEAEQVLRDALAVRRQVLGNSDPEVARTLIALSEVLSKKGEYEASEPLIREALAIRQAAYGKVHPQVAESIEYLGLSYFERDDFEAALTHLRDAVAMRRQLHGEVHPALAQAIDNLSWALMGLGRADDAEPLSREAVAMKRRLFGDVHPETAAGLNNLAYILEARGNFRAAESAYRESLEVNRRLLGPSHPTVTTTMSNVAFVMYAKGDRAGAIDLLRQAWQVSRRELGAEHPDVAGTASSLAYWLVEAQAHEEAARLVEESLEARRRAHGNEHPRVASTLTVKANLLLATNRYREAAETAAEARRILALSLPEEHWQVAFAMNAHGEALVRLGAYADAEPLLLRILDRLSPAPIPHLADRGRARLAELYRAWGKPSEASKYIARN